MLYAIHIGFFSENKITNIPGDPCDRPWCVRRGRRCANDPERRGELIFSLPSGDQKYIVA